MVSLLSAARLFVCCFIAFIGVFCVVFWEEHRHEWVLYALMLMASCSAIWFFRYLHEIESYEIRSQFRWNARYLCYGIFISCFIANLLGVFVTASIIQSAGISIEDEISKFGAHTLVAAIILSALWCCSLVLSLMMYNMHWSVIERHDCLTSRQRASAGCLKLTDNIWMMPSETSPHDASEITVLAANSLLRDE